MDELKSIQWYNGKVRLLDQRKLPDELVLLEISDYIGVVNAINNMSLRGAPLIGIAAAFGVVLAVWDLDESDRPGFLKKANHAIDAIKNTRPTAKNLFWALDAMRKTMSKNLNHSIGEVKQALLRKAQQILEDDIERCKKIGDFGQELLPNRANVLTHCNAGALATADYGTALGVLRSAVKAGKKVKVYADETRPLLQGARLTAFELVEDGFDVTVICDNMAAVVMKKGLVNAVLVGADRIAANGDVANKIGTYGLAVLAKAHNIPFYVAAPFSTFDTELASGEDIPIEERSSDEIVYFNERPIVPEEAKVYNPAFDVTPHEYIHAIITERGVLKPPFNESIAQQQK